MSISSSAIGKSSSAVSSAPRSACSKKYQIVFIASEVGPWSKTGGLGEVMDGLPIALAQRGHRVMTVAPRWDQYYDAWDTSVVEELEWGSTVTPVRFFHAFKQKVDRVFIDHPVFLERVWGQTGQKIYGPSWGSDWSDNQMRFSLFVRAALVALKKVPCGGYPYGEDVVIVCNDWHTGLCPLYINQERQRTGAWQNAKVCLLMHNMVYQGRFAYEPWMPEAYRLPSSVLQDMRCMMPLKVGRAMPKVDCINWMKGSLAMCDRLLTVSPSYASEIMADSIKGVELNAELKNHRGNGVHGILNGVKYGISPNSATLIRTANLPCAYDEKTLHLKDLIKEQFRQRVGLPNVPGAPLLMFIGRLDFQKGVDILLSALSNVILPMHDVQVCVIGQGREDLMKQVATLKEKYPTKFTSELAFKGPDKYWAYAGSDFAIMPSRYEPCGLVQMESMRFGVVPVITPTGGLKDTVVHKKTGIVCTAEMEQDSIVTPESEQVLANAIREAINIYKETPEIHRQMQIQGMLTAKDYNWSNAAIKYEHIFDDMNVPNVRPLCLGMDHQDVGEDVV